MVHDALQWAMVEGAGAPPLSRIEYARGAAPGRSWQDTADGLALALDGACLESLVAEAASWAERIAVCVTAPQSQRGELPWWRELLARITKCEGVYVRRAERSESWLLSRLHATGTLRLVEGGGKQAAAQLLMFARGREVRLVLAHIPLERAAAGAAFGALLSFRGGDEASVARACRAQLSSWAERSRIPTGSEIDALAMPRSRKALAPVQLPSSLRIVTEHEGVSARVERFSAAVGDGVLSARELAGGFRIGLSPAEDGRAATVLTLRTAEGWSAGNALLLESADGELVLVWRGGLLGSSRSRGELLWSEVRLPCLKLDDPRLGSTNEVAVVAHTGAPLAPQIERFVREMARLSAAFGVEPPPVLGHALSEFHTLSRQQQTLLVWRALLGTGALDVDSAARLALDALRDQGYLRAEGREAELAHQGAIARLLDAALQSRRCFDSPASGHIRAVQPDAAAYVSDDWLDCLLRALPAGVCVARRTALRLSFERARSVWGLSNERLCRNGRTWLAIEQAIALALERGLIVRHGASGLVRLGRSESCPVALPSPMAREEAREGVLAGWDRALERLTAVERCILARRTGWYGRSEALASVADRLGLTLENARLIEYDAWRRLETESPWAAMWRTRLERALAGARLVPLRELSSDDAWWRGIERHGALARAALEQLSGRTLHYVELGPPSHRESFFARFSQAELDAAWQSLLQRAAQLPLPACLDDCARLCAQAGDGLDGDLGEHFREALEARLELDAGDPTRVVGWTDAELTTLPAPSIEREAASSEALLRLEDTLRSVFRAAGTPLPLASITERTRARLDVDTVTLEQRLGSAPFIRRNADQYGLVQRDVPGGHEAIATLLDGVTHALEAGQRELGPERAAMLVPERVRQLWSADLLRSLLCNDPVLVLTPAGSVRLRRWEHARPLPHGELICPGLPPRSRPRFEKLAEAAPASPEQQLQHLREELQRLERAADADPILLLPLVRHLFDLHERLLAATRSQPGSMPKPSLHELAPAALQFLLDAVAPPEGDSLDAPAIDRDRLLEARSVLAAVLRWLGFDWLAGEPRCVI